MKLSIKTLVAVSLVCLSCLHSTFGAFVHPGQFYTANDLAFMRQKIAAHAEPWFSAWEHGFKLRNAKRPTNATAEWDATKDGYMGSDPLTAHKEALAWALTGDPAHAANAIEILNAWSATLQKIVPHKMPQEMVAAANANHLKTGLAQSGQDLLAANSREPAHVSTSIR